MSTWIGIIFATLLLAVPFVCRALSPSDTVAQGVKIAAVVVYAMMGAHLVNLEGEFASYEFRRIMWPARRVATFVFVAIGAGVIAIASWLAD